MSLTYKITALLSVFAVFSSIVFAYVSESDHPNTLFAIQSIDTMKDSRDLARIMLKDSSFDSMINQEMMLIASSGATHVAIDTPYDAEFLPVLRLWVTSARAHGLSIWFRGNFSGWEKWFDYPAMSENEHIEATKQFLTNNHDIFVSGDIFTPCPECENGGPGDPRKTGNVTGFREFLMREHKEAEQIFKNNQKNVSVYSSMNPDVAKIVMDRATTKALGGIVVIDDYSPSAERLESYIHALHEQTKAPVFLGEFGAPIPDINGSMTEEEQAAFIESLYVVLKRNNDIVYGTNYWVLRQGSTALINDDMTPRIAYDVVKKYYSMPFSSSNK